ncbi:hypothetical protein [Bacillus thuringiensis]|uniref:hypothetical protein n=1 Tax=Bacillus thuringiensis TaxID=1428 RepID=UPI0026E45D43|nr:hypothetical protein [Bacillus thuringiensis]MDO6628789.1 hypothetical protein [Bacillus thuringiensis]MDO6659292.1 hypothetical protein [Bacillus thuringiensis]MDO6698874.1 hypothetical protein [Bacillus thuringiensis]
MTGALILLFISLALLFGATKITIFSWFTSVLFYISGLIFGLSIRRKDDNSSVFKETLKK